MALCCSKSSWLLGILVLGLGGLNVYQFLESRTSHKELSAAQQERDVAQKPETVIDRFHVMVYDAMEKTWQSNSWLGVQCWQNPNDVWIHQEVISEVKPDLIIEAGTHRGGSALIWSMILEQIHPTGKVVTMDINDLTKDAAKFPAWKDRVTFLLGSSTSPETVEKVKKMAEGKKVMVILDSNHAKDHVLAEMKIYGPLVPVGGYMIVQDTNINGHPVYKSFGPGPMEAVDEFLAENKDFEPDKNCERLMFTMHPKGYLKRVK